MSRFKLTETIQHGIPKWDKPARNAAKRRKKKEKPFVRSLTSQRKAARKNKSIYEQAVATIQGVIDAPHSFQRTDDAGYPV